MNPAWLQAGMLRAASLMAPADRRGEWMADWRSELWYVPRGERTRFCMGAFRDALWLRRNESSRTAFLESPVACLLFLAAMAVLSSLLSIWLPPPRTIPTDRLRLRDLPAGWAVMLVLAGVLLPAARMVIGPGSAGSDGSSASRLRRGVFLALKVALVQPMVLGGFLLALWILPVVPIAPQLALGAAWMWSFRWVLVDQRRRCPECLRLLGAPVRIGAPSQTLLEWYGAELVCSRGHGLLHRTEVMTSYSSRPQWHRLDESWRGLFADAAGERR